VTMSNKEISSFIELRSKSANTVQFLDLDSRMEFIKAVLKAKTVNQVAEPYRSWILSPKTIPSENLSVKQ